MTAAMTITRPIAYRLLRDGHGGTAVEMALLFPFLSLMILGAIDAGWMLWSASTLDFAVEEAARCAAVDAANCGTTANIQGVAVSKAMGLSMSASDFTVTTATCGKKVAATYIFPFLMPFSTNFNISIPATSCYPLPSLPPP
jgi:Flp pilus assembly protein TadG